MDLRRPASVPLIQSFAQNKYLMVQTQQISDRDRAGPNGLTTDSRDNVKDIPTLNCCCCCFELLISENKRRSSDQSEQTVGSHLKKSVPIEAQKG